MAELPSWDQAPQAHRAADQPQGKIERQAEVGQDAYAVAGRIGDLDLHGVEDGSTCSRRANARATSTYLRGGQITLTWRYFLSLSSHDN